MIWPRWRETIQHLALATLLVSGPSTQEEISADLGLNYGLTERMASLLLLAVFVVPLVMLGLDRLAWVDLDL
jgi:hypothetical protein